MPAEAKKKTVKKKRGRSRSRKRTYVKVKLTRSLIGASPHQRAVMAGLGLRKINQIVERVDTRETRGMIFKVSHLVEIVSE